MPEMDHHKHLDCHVRQLFTLVIMLTPGTISFLERHSNGYAKTHLAQALVHEACRQGFDALFTSVAKLLQHINGGRADGTLERRLQAMLRPDLLVLDDFGLKPLQPSGPSDLYDIIDGRYEQGSILLTSNRAPAEWPDIFLDPLLASAGLDRLGDHAEVLVITGVSYRAQARLQT
jgi:DNA replication protein DnaC